MNKGRLREIKKLVVDAGASLLECCVCGSGHYRTVLGRPDGESRIFIFSNTPGDHRGDLNKRSMVRRWVRENTIELEAAA